VLVTLGNNADSSNQQNCFFKDVRVWTSKRSPFDLFSYRFKQVKPDPALLLNFKLMNGNLAIRNVADVSQPQANVKGASYVASDKQNIVCASDRYFVPTLG
jgi:hypothetical protein